MLSMLPTQEGRPACQNVGYSNILQLFIDVTYCFQVVKIKVVIMLDPVQPD